MVGVDPTVYYPNVGTAGASVLPEYPAPPFIPGTKALGSDGSEFIFVQASTSIGLTDFVLVNIGQGASPYQANSVTTTNVLSSLAVGIASTGLVLRQSVTFIPAGSMFWACTKGQLLPATTSGGTSTGLATNSGGVQLFTTSTAGVINSQTVSQSLNTAIVGIICVNSLTVSIPASIVPPAGTLSNGYTVGPVVNLNNARAANLTSVTISVVVSVVSSLGDTLVANTTTQTATVNANSQAVYSF